MRVVNTRDITKLPLHTDIELVFLERGEELEITAPHLIISGVVSEEEGGLVVALGSGNDIIFSKIKAEEGCVITPYPAADREHYLDARERRLDFQHKKINYKTTRNFVDGTGFNRLSNKRCAQILGVSESSISRARKSGESLG